MSETKAVGGARGWIVSRRHSDTLVTVLVKGPDVWDPDLEEERPGARWLLEREHAYELAKLLFVAAEPEPERVELDERPHCFACLRVNPGGLQQFGIGPQRNVSVCHECADQLGMDLMPWESDE